MPTAPGPAYVPTQFTDGAANDGGRTFGFLDRFFGADTRETVIEKAQDARALVTEKAQDARASLTTGGAKLAATARAHPVLTILTLVGGAVAIGLLANPASRRAAIAGGTALWSKYGDKLPALLAKP